jgi:hypothetical protein
MDDTGDVPTKIFGNWLTIFRIEAQLSQEALAEAA